jgi:hypothetical protein
MIYKMFLGDKWHKLKEKMEHSGDLRQVYA